MSHLLFFWFRDMDDHCMSSFISTIFMYGNLHVMNSELSYLLPVFGTLMLDPSRTLDSFSAWVMVLRYSSKVTVGHLHLILVSPAFFSGNELPFLQTLGAWCKDKPLHCSIFIHCWPFFLWGNDCNNVMASHEIGPKVQLDVQVVWFQTKNGHETSLRSEAFEKNISNNISNSRHTNVNINNMDVSKNRGTPKSSICS